MTASGTRNKQCTDPPRVSGSSSKPTARPKPSPASDGPGTTSRCRAITMALAIPSRRFIDRRRVSGLSANRTVSAEIIATFGWSGHDIPVPGDYDGFGYTEPAVYRPSTGQWFVFEPDGSTEQLPDFGWPGHDYPAPGDYDGFGYVEQAVYRPSTAQWFVLEPDGTTEVFTTFGWTGHDLPATTPIYALVQTGVIGGISKTSLDTATGPLISETLPTVTSVSLAPSSSPNQGTSRLHVVLKKPFPSGALGSASRLIGKKHNVGQARIHSLGYRPHSSEFML